MSGDQRPAHLKVILETGELATYDNVRRASWLAMLAGADFIKTSTGKVSPAATLPVTVVMLEAVRLSREILAQPAFAPFRGPEVLPGDDVRDLAGLTAFIRRKAETVYHPVGTCRMGRPEDADTVVDPQLRVKGVDGLRVVDASVMPKLIGGNTNAPTMMIAERAADLILGQAA